MWSPISHEFASLLQDDAKEPIGSLPGQYRWGLKQLIAGMEPLVAKGLRSVLVFGVVAVRTMTAELFSRCVRWETAFPLAFRTQA